LPGLFGRNGERGLLTMDCEQQSGNRQQAKQNSRLNNSHGRLEVDLTA
jgi:hypothetical protein